MFFAGISEGDSVLTHTSHSTDLPLASDTTYAVPFTGSLTGQVTVRARGLYTLTENWERGRER